MRSTGFVLSWRFASQTNIMAFTYSLGNFRAIYLVSLCCIGYVFIQRLKLTQTPERRSYKSTTGLFCSLMTLELLVS